MKGRAVRKLLLSVLTAVMIVLIRPVPVQADWIQDKFGWWFQEDDGSFPEPGRLFSDRRLFHILPSAQAGT